MGAVNSNLTQSSEVGTLNWNNISESEKVKESKDFSVKKLDNGIEENELDINSLSNSQSSIEDLNNVFHKIKDEIEKSEEKNDDESSPFISTELYNKIMNGGNNTSSPFISNNLNANGGYDSSSSSSSSSSSLSSKSDSDSSTEMLRALSEISISSSEYPTNNFKKQKFMNKEKSKYSKSVSSEDVKGYNFSDTSSIMENDSQNNFIGGTSSETSYKLNSSSIRTSDVRVVSVDSVNGRRYLN